MEVLAELARNLENGEKERVAELTQQAIDQGIAPKQILDDGLIAGMNVVGQRFKVHEIFLPDVLMAAGAMHAGLDKLRPLLIAQGVPPIGKVVLGSVQGDLHDIGKNLVGILLKGAGFEVIDLGNDVSPASFVAAAKEHAAPIIGLSALLTTTMPVMEQVVDLVKSEGLSAQVKVIIGGAPVSADYANQIGADAYGYDAANAVEQVKALVSTSSP